MIKYIWWLRSSKTRPVLCLTRVHKHAVEVLQIQISCGIIILSRESIDVISLALGIIFQSWVTFKIMSWKRCFNYSTHLLPIVFSQDSKIPLNHFSVFIILLDFVLIFNLYIYHFSHNFNCVYEEPISNSLSPLSLMVTVIHLHASVQLTILITLCMSSNLNRIYTVSGKNIHMSWDFFFFFQSVKRSWPRVFLEAFCSIGYVDTII